MCEFERSYYWLRERAADDRARRWLGKIYFEHLALCRQIAIERKPDTLDRLIVELTRVERLMAAARQRTEARRTQKAVA